MPSAMDAARSRGGQSGKILKGQHLYDAKPKRLTEVMVTFKVVRDPGPQFNSPLIADLATPCLDQDSVALNKTNIKRLTSLLGDDYEKWAGAKVTFERYLTNNPQTGQQAMGLVVTSASAAGSKKVLEYDASDDVPF
jgi:hypothetical protein